MQIASSYSSTMYGHLAPHVVQVPCAWSDSPDSQYDEQILPGLQELLESTSTGLCRQPETLTTVSGRAAPVSLQDLQPIPAGFTLQPYNVDYTSSQARLDPVLFRESVLGDLRTTTTTACGDVKLEKDSTDSGRQSASPTGSSSLKDSAAPRATDKSQVPLDKKALAKQRYREKNRKAQARHRERNKRTIEDLTAKVSALTAENQNLKLEMAIVTTVAKAKDEHLSKLRKSKEKLSLMEAESLIAESYQVVNGVDSEPSAEHVEKWCMQDSAAVRQANIQRMASLLMEGGLNDITSPAFQKLQVEMTRKRQLSLRFAVGKPRFVRSLYAWEREYCKHLTKPNFDELWRSAVTVMRFTEAQRMQMVHARGLLIAKMHTILNERKSLLAAAKAGAMEGVEDVLTSSLEEERQAVFGFLFTFFDEVTSCAQTLTLLQEGSCDVELYPWAPDVLAISDILMEDAVAASPTGIEGLNLPAHLIPTRDGQMDLDALLMPAKKHLSRLCQASEVAEIARAAGVEWPPETPFQQLSIPVTTRSCGTSGISLLRNKLMFAGGVMPVQLPNIPREVLTRIPILNMIRPQHSQSQ